MNPKVRTLKETPEYIEQEALLGIKRLQYRVYKKECKTEFRFTDDFARSWGAKDLDDLIRKLNMQHEVAITGLPEWVEVKKDFIRWEKKADLN
ncbi:hypothetical protein [uncultured Parabacteroides sp.]|uniref:hypothetical protein n=1 Tax=uncultured Parabacteroides sp. TaxID=512312 RepID=UPI0025993071|nr:hypothetical protein [uncultured Parabacteroides sp.]